LSLAAALSLIALLVGPLWNSVDPVKPASVAAASATLPASPGAWVGPRSVNTHWTPIFAGADIEQRGQYVQGDKRVDAYMAVYASQAQDKELVRYDNSLIGSERASIIASSRIEPKGPATELVVETQQGEQSVLWYFYQIDSLQTARGIVAQLWYGWSSVFGSPVSRVVALRSPCLPDCDAARGELGAMMNASNF
jgi:EpsI family protein